MPGYSLDKHVEESGQITPYGRELQDKILEQASTGQTQIQIAEELDTSPATIRKLRNLDAGFSEELERRLFEASTLVVDEIRQVPYQETDAALARVKIDALARFLELRWPHRYGKRLDVTVRSLDMGKALAEAKQRRAQVIDGQYKVLDQATDSESVADDSGPDIADMIE